MPRRKSDIPFASQFTPEQIDLPRLLRIAKEHEGDRERIEEAIRREFFSTHAGGDLDQQRELAKNPVLALREYSLLDSTASNLTEVGNQLVGLSDCPQALYEHLARHILLHLHGLEVINTIRDMQNAGAGIRLETMSKWLGERGLYVPPSGTHISGMKAWLQKAGIIENDYTIHEDHLGQVLGMPIDDIDSLGALTDVQRAFLRALAVIPEAGPLPSNRVAQFAERLYGVEFPSKNLASQVILPLQEAGYIEAEKSTGGRGAKPYIIMRTDKLKQEIIEPLIATIEASTGLLYRHLYQKPLAEILTELRSSSRDVKGQALEALAVYIMRLLDLELVAWRLRARDTTASAEVDVIVEGARLIFSRWQIQCKNTPQVALDDVAKEVGLGMYLKSNVIMVISTGRFTKAAYDYAQSMMESSNLQIVLLHKGHLDRLTADPTRIVDILHNEAENAMRIKRVQFQALEGQP